MGRGPVGSDQGNVASEPTDEKWTCRICGAGFSLSDEGDGWPTLAASQDFLRDHARCLAAADAEEIREAYTKPA